MSFNYSFNNIKTQARAFGFGNNITAAKKFFKNSVLLVFGNSHPFITHKKNCFLFILFTYPYLYLTSFAGIFNGVGYYVLESLFDFFPIGKNFQILF